MNDLIGRVLDFQRDIFPDQSELYGRLASNGQSPKALIISCADSRVVPEEIIRARPGDLFVCRNAGNIVPPFQEAIGGVSATLEYAILALGVRDVIVCGHSDCGAMKALMDPAPLAGMPSVTAWLSHSAAARHVVAANYPGLSAKESARAAAMENVVVQLAHLRTHPSAAAAIASGQLTLHGWFFDIGAGQVLALDGDDGRFRPIVAGEPLPVALLPKRRAVADLQPIMEAAE